MPTCSTLSASLSFRYCKLHCVVTHLVIEEICHRNRVSTSTNLPRESLTVNSTVELSVAPLAARLSTDSSLTEGAMSSRLALGRSQEYEVGGGLRIYIRANKKNF